MPEATRRLEDPFRFRVAIEHDFKRIPINIVPDRMVSLLYDDNHRHNCVSKSIWVR